MKITVEDKGNVVHITRELFDLEQDESDFQADFKLLIRSLRACRDGGNCERCLLCNLDMGDNHCDDVLKEIAASQIEKLAGL